MLRLVLPRQRAKVSKLLLPTLSVPSLEVLREPKPRERRLELQPRQRPRESPRLSVLDKPLQSRLLRLRLRRHLRLTPSARSWGLSLERQMDRLLALRLLLLAPKLQTPSVLFSAQRPAC